MENESKYIDALFHADESILWRNKVKNAFTQKDISVVQFEGLEDALSNLEEIVVKERKGYRLYLLNLSLDNKKHDEVKKSKVENGEGLYHYINKLHESLGLKPQIVVMDLHYWVLKEFFERENKPNVDGTSRPMIRYEPDFFEVLYKVYSGGVEQYKGKLMENAVPK